jgi:hypothetical protein
MGEFVNNRDKYPSLKDYFPKFVDFINAIPVEE